MQTAAKQNLNYMAKSNAGVKKWQLIFNNVFCKHPKHGSHRTACHYTAYFTNRDSSRTLRNICVRTFWWWGDLCIKAFSICPALQWVCVWVLNPTRKHGRPPNQEGSANKPPVSGWSVVKLLVSCGACISKLKLPVLRTMNCLAGGVFNVASRLFGLSDPFFLLNIITDASSQPTSTAVHTKAKSSRGSVEMLLTVFFTFGFISTLD